jgi:hypothetical protein
LPQLLEDPLAVLFDTGSGNLLYVLPEPSARRPQLAVELDYRRRGERLNMLVSGYRPPVQNLLERIRAGGLRVVRGALDAAPAG